MVQADGSEPLTVPSSVIAEFLLQQQQGLRQSSGDGQRQQKKRGLPRWLRRMLAVSGAVGLVAGGVALGRHLHSNYMVRVAAVVDGAHRPGRELQTRLDAFCLYTPSVPPRRAVHHHSDITPP